MIVNIHTGEVHTEGELSCRNCGFDQVYVVPAPRGLKRVGVTWPDRLTTRLQCWECGHEWWSTHLAVAEEVPQRQTRRWKRQIESPYGVFVY